MQTAKHYREKAAEMERLRVSAEPDMRPHWARMASEWTALARRAEREDRFVRRYAPKS